jgi:hypothetical protein
VPARVWHVVYLSPRTTFADATLVVVPKSVEGDETLLKAILPLTDVMGTGHYAALLAGVHPGGTVAKQIFRNQ